MKPTRRHFLTFSSGLAASTLIFRGSAWAVDDQETTDLATPSKDKSAGDAEATEPAGSERLTYDNPKTQRWRVGLKLETNGTTCRDVLATFPIPMDWPEQTVKVVDQNIDSRVERWAPRDLPGGARQIVLTMSKVLRGTDPEVTFDLEVTRSRTVGPETTDDLVIPTKLSNDLKIYLGNSPYIDATDGKIKLAAKQFADAESGETPWARVEAMYDWVRDKVKYQEGDIKSASKALKDGVGDCEELTSLFVAMCRANKIPARMVWIPDHCYPEFYLEDASGKGYWFPCQAAGTRQFGSMSEYRPVLQKGDRFKVPEKNKPDRYVAEFFRCIPESKTPPTPVFLRELIGE